MKEETEIEFTNIEESDLKSEQFFNVNSYSKKSFELFEIKTDNENELLPSPILKKTKEKKEGRKINFSTHARVHFDKTHNSRKFKNINPFNLPMYIFRSICKHSFTNTFSCTITNHLYFCYTLTI
jgi:hypothetical protein